MYFDPASSFILSPYSLGSIGVFGFALLLSVTVLVTSAPSAWTPSAMMAGAGKAAEYGVLFKGAGAIENRQAADDRLRQDRHPPRRTNHR